MIIPREGDKVRLYIQLSDKEAGVNSETGRVDKSKISPEQLMEVARESFKPYRIEKVGDIDWWTIYISQCLPSLALSSGVLIYVVGLVWVVVGQRVASKFSVNERVFIAGDACHTHSPKAGMYPFSLSVLHVLRFSDWGYVDRSRSGYERKHE